MGGHHVQRRPRVQPGDVRSADNGLLALPCREAQVVMTSGLPIGVLVTPSTTLERLVNSPAQNSVRSQSAADDAQLPEC